jgi:hypothetical protein
MDVQQILIDCQTLPGKGLSRLPKVIIAEKRVIRLGSDRFFVRKIFLHMKTFGGI